MSSIEPHLKSLAEADTVIAVRDALASFAGSIGMRFGSLSTCIPLGEEDEGFAAIATMPPGYDELFSSGGEADPVMQTVRTTRTALAWDERIYVEHGVGETWELQAQYGIAQGVCMAVHCRDRHSVLLGFDAPREKVSDRIKAFQISSLQLAMAYVMEFAKDQLFPTPQKYIRALSLGLGPSDGVWASDSLKMMQAPGVSRTAKLTNREIECMKWVASGKSSQEIALILGISASTVNKYIDRVMQNLGCGKRIQAVDALRSMGMLT